MKHIMSYEFCFEVTTQDGTRLHAIADGFAVSCTLSVCSRSVVSNSLTEAGSSMVGFCTF